MAEIGARQHRRVTPGAPPGAGGPFAGGAPTVIRELPGGGGRWCLDTTAAELDSSSTVLDLRGWVALDPGVVLEGAPRLDTSAGVRPLATVERSDVAAELGTANAVGFDEVVDLSELADSTGAVVVRVNGEDRELYLPPVTARDERAEAFSARKSALLERIRPLLACPNGHGDLVEGADARLACGRCGYRGRRAPLAFELVPDGVAIDNPTPPFSSHTYDAEPRDLAAGHELVLDYGSGLRYETFANIVNLDLSRFPTTDVCASCLAVPFADGSFDGLISVAVLEHLPDPQRAAAEIARVVRPGGAVYIAVPFLQPYHGWPGHYFNMTRDALRVLFEERFSIDDITTPRGGVPMQALTWMISWYLGGLPEPLRSEFAQRRLGEFAGGAEPHLDQDYVTALDPEVVVELASVNVVHAHRRAR